MAHIRFSPGAVIDVRGAEYHPAYAHGRVQLTHLITGEIFKYEQKDGSPELPTVELFQLMQHCGDAVIRAFNLRYHDIQAVPELLRDLVPIEPRRQRRSDATATVEFRYDSMDISRIHVWNRKTRKYAELTCADERYSSGMPLWLHEQIEREAQKQGLVFNTQEERMNARGHLIDAIRNISPGDLAASRKRLAALIEVPRIRQVTGNIVDLVHGAPSSVTPGDFIANDRARLTSLDQDILSSRPDPRTKSPKSALERRREHAKQEQCEPNAPDRERRLPMNKGGYR